MFTRNAGSKTNKCPNEISPVKTYTVVYNGHVMEIKATSLEYLYSFLGTLNIYEGDVSVSEQTEGTADES